MAVDFKDYGRRMDKALDHLADEFGAVRAGRANPKVLDRITVEYYGSETPLNGVATISAPDHRSVPRVSTRQFEPRYRPKSHRNLRYFYTPLSTN